MIFQRAKCACCGEAMEACVCRRLTCVDVAEGEALTFVDGHDDAILGMADVEGEWRVVYDQETIVRKLMARDAMDRQGAVELFEYNIEGSKIGSAHPLFLKAC
ncbi:hypothetical protein HH212_22860 [Massilia forsythiae]|uniref:Uncharacterized protein n=1 Tax=Massilia forsythiae TaxID=2728020 RepID=A0A7Z2W0G9_9BURK|nr:hypothetical protein [Massilia forsythiae]QJE02508.1 hypothetical protein HH212_22860 [Massilia forsythiae]